VRTEQTGLWPSFFLALCICGGVCAAPYRNFKEAFKDAEGRANQRDFPAAAAAAAAAQSLARTSANKAEAALLRAQIAMCAGDSDTATREYNALFADKAVALSKRFEAFLTITGMKAAMNKTAVSKEQWEKAKRRLAAEGMTTADRYAAFNNAARAMTRLRNYKIAREMLACADSLAVKKETKVYHCRYMERAPLGAGGWFLSDFIKNPANREGRFGDYKQSSADMLFTDVTADRSVSSGNAKRDYYIKNTGFYMVYDKAGWHMFVLCGEPAIEGMLADGKSAGSLEMYFAPATKGETYFQWIISLPDGKADFYDWNSPHRFFRPVKSYVRTETLTLDGNVGTYIFIPWEALYDKLPLDGEKWLFGIIRWTPAGGITWGGKVHETGKWGLVEWEKPTPEQALAVRKNIVRKAWARYKKSRETQTTHWKDPILGDGRFFDEMINSVIQRLDRYGDGLKDPGNLTSEEAVELCKNAVPDWMEFDYLVSDLRRKYLENTLIAK